MTDLLMKFLVSEYIALFVFCILETKYVLAVYWLGATILQIAVILGIKS